MSVKLKVIIIVILTAIFVAFFTSNFFNFTISKYISILEERDINKSFEVLDTILEREKNNLLETSRDWSYWDQTYNFLENKDNEYVESNLGGETLQSLKINFMFFMDSNNKVFYEESNELSGAEKDILIKKIINKDNHFSDGKEYGGILGGQDKLYVVAITPIISETSGKSNGKLIIGEVIDEEVLQYMNTVMKGKVDLNNQQILVDSTDYIKVNTDHDFITAYKPVEDINGNHSITAVFTVKRYFYNIGIYYMKVFFSIFIVMLIIATLFSIFFIDKYILRRLHIVNKFIDSVGKTKDTTARIKLSGGDDFSKIGNSINHMLESLHAADKEIKEMDERFKLIMEATKDGYLDLNLQDKKLYINGEWKTELGYKSNSESELFYEHYAKIHPDDVKKLKERHLKSRATHTEYFDEIYQMFKTSGEIIWVLERGKIVQTDKDGKPLRVVSILLNITDGKKYEEEILMLSYLDKLTNLKSRLYMEKQFKDIDDKNIPYFIIIGDVNGLKLINDALGHKEGDKLLKTISSKLKDLCSNDDIVSRWDGDEFIILVKDKEKAYVETLVRNIKSVCENLEDFPMRITMALGYARKDENNTDSEQVMNLAEKRMYRNKLIENKSVRNAIISSLLRTLHEKHSETEEHTMRIKNMSLKLGKVLGLSQDKLDELELLSLLHDIGKIGIPESILLKPAKLTDEEWKIMKTHSEIGYRIAKSTPELSHIAENILAHHEKYDGTGYPNGLKGEEIPLLARIINIIDSFDVMTNKRVYKDDYDISYAIEELKRCSGTQFDPDIVGRFLELLQEGSNCIIEKQF